MILNIGDKFLYTGHTRRITTGEVTAINPNYTYKISWSDSTIHDYDSYIIDDCIGVGLWIKFSTEKELLAHILKL